MAQHRCHGVPTDTMNLRKSKDYCDGRQAAYEGLDKTNDNPHPATSDDGVVWIAGFDSYAGGVGTPLQQDCCAHLAYDGV